MFLIIKTLSQNISIALLQISLKLHEHWGCYWKKKLPWMIFEEQFPVPRYTAASKIGNSVISLLWQLRCHCNPDHNKFSSLSNTTVVSIFPKLCLWRRSLCSNLGGVDPQKLYRATLSKMELHFINSKWRMVPDRFITMNDLSWHHCYQLKAINVFADFYFDNQVYTFHCWRFNSM